MDKHGQNKIAAERIDKLFVMAEKKFSSNPEFSRRYVILARKIAMRYRIRFSRDQKMLFCKGCNVFFKKGVNSTIRIRSGRIILRCTECGYVRRFAYTK